jgi:hypothetical protein
MGVLLVRKAPHRDLLRVHFVHGGLSMTSTSGLKATRLICLLALRRVGVIDSFRTGVAVIASKLIFRGCCAHAAMVAHATTTAIVQLAIQRASAEYPTATFAYDVIIDDASWSSCNEEACREVERQFDAICSDFNVTIGSKTPTSGLLVHRGVIVDLQAQSVKLRQSFIDKHKARRDLLSRTPTFARCRSALGTLVYYATISPTIREQIPELLRIVARVARTTTKQAIAAASERLVTAVDVMVQNHEWHTTDVDATPFGGYVFSDATPTSWGSIYVDLLGEVTFAKGRFENPMKIHLAEATAMIQTTKQLVPKTSYQRCSPQTTPHGCTQYRRCGPRTTNCKTDG